MKQKNQGSLFGFVVAIFMMVVHLWVFKGSRDTAVIVALIGFFGTWIRYDIYYYHEHYVKKNKGAGRT